MRCRWLALLGLAVSLSARADDLGERIRQAAARHGPSLVRVQATTSLQVERLPGIARQARRVQQVSTGGVVVDGEGLVVFAARALDPAAEAFALLGAQARADVLNLSVIGQDGRAREAEWLGRSAELGLAFARVRATGRAGLTPVAFDGAPPPLGEAVLVLGLSPAPLGGKPQVEPARVASVGEGLLLLTPRLPGSEGGLVLGPEGKAVGLLIRPELPTAVEGDLLRFDALGPARDGLVLPAARLKPAIAKPPVEAPTQAQRRRGRTWIGARHQEVTPELAEAKKLPVDVGVYLDEVWDGPAKKAGLQAGDVLVQLDGEPLELDPGEQFSDLIQGYLPGQRVEVKALRADKQVTATLELEEGPTRPQDAQRASVAEVGLLLRDLTFFDRRELGLDAQTPGAVVVEIEPDGAASRAGLRPGDVLLQIDGEALGGLVDAQQRLASAGDHALTLRRRNETLTLKVRR